MRRTAHPLTFLVSLLLAALMGCGREQKQPDLTQQELRDRLSRPGVPTIVSVQDSIFSPMQLHSFYEANSMQPAWSAEKNLLPVADSLLSAIHESDRDGLDPTIYHLRSLDSLRAELRRRYTGREPIAPSLRTDLDLLLTDAAILFGCHLAEGVIAKDSLRVRWTADSSSVRYDSLLNALLQSQTVKQVFQSLHPQHQSYAGLKQMLVNLEATSKKGGWGSVPAGPALAPGASGKRVFALRNRLWASGDLAGRTGWQSDEFDSTLVDGVRSFQRRHGLEPSGTADSATVAELNVPIGKRIEQIKINLERWRWMPHVLGRKHILVNIPDFRLTVVEDGEEVMKMKVVLGLPNWQTPVFSAAMTHVLFNVHWIAPDDILSKELINYMKADSNYLRSNEMTLWRKSGDTLVKVDPHTIQWAEMNENNIDFFLRQEGGPQNIMGQVKFLIPNPHNVYLHDTPYREDFPKNIRMFSHGCIRLEKPFDLAEYVLRQFPDWERERIDTVVARKTEQTLTLKHSIPVHIVYCTAWREKDGSAHFRQDFYGLDQRLGAVLLARR